MLLEVPYVFHLNLFSHLLKNLYHILHILLQYIVYHHIFLIILNIIMIDLINLVYIMTFVMVKIASNLTFLSMIYLILLMNINWIFYSSIVLHTIILQQNYYLYVLIFQLIQFYNFLHLFMTYILINLILKHLVNVFIQLHRIIYL